MLRVGSGARSEPLRAGQARAAARRTTQTRHHQITGFAVATNLTVTANPTAGQIL